METPDLGRWFNVLETTHSTTVTEGSGDGSVPDFGFTPAPNTRYYVEGVCMLRSTSSLNGRAARIGLAWPTSGVTEQVLQLFGTGLYIGPCFNHCEGELLTVNRTLLFTGMSVTTYSYPAMFRAWFETGPVVVGDFQVLLHASNVASSVSVRAGSFLAVYSGFTNQ
jgi:hypothetical protein